MPSQHETFYPRCERVYVNENLTALRPKLFKKVIDRVESHESWRSWTLDGKTALPLMLAVMRTSLLQIHFTA